MRLAKILGVLVILIVSSYSVAWYYLAYKLNKNISENYLNRQITHNLSYKEHNLQFTSATVSGFPFKLQANLNGFTEETDIEKIIYKNPVIIGYDILDSKAFIDYHGQIKAVFKPLIAGFGAIFDVNDYKISVSITSPTELFTAIINEENFAKVVLSNIDNIKISSGAVKIADLIDNKVFYSTEYEELDFSFIPRKKYNNLKDFFNSLPSKSNIAYKVKTNAIKNDMKKIVPDILLYVWKQLPDDFEFNTKLEITTEAEKFIAALQNINIDGQMSIKSNIIDLQIKNLHYKSITNKESNKVILKTDTKFRLKDDFFTKLFTYHKMFKSHLDIVTPRKANLNSKIKYIKDHQDLFRLNELKNIDYNLMLDITYQNAQGNLELKIMEFTAASENTGFRIINGNFSTTPDGDNKNYGVLYLQNYKYLIKFIANFVYEIYDNTQYLRDYEKQLLAETTLDLCKYASDHNKSTSKDLSIKYNISNDTEDSTFGKVKINYIGAYHRLLLYLKIINKVSKTGDILENMQKYTPNIIIDPELLAILLSKDGKLKKEFEKLLKDSGQLLQKLEKINDYNNNYR
ncbi:MAG: hypothetical protein HRU35_04620 [Rickettsiaceae bacterium]|nr:hypothetical protein [Rickettsiaceae bacterium]